MTQKDPKPPAELSMCVCGGWPTPCAKRQNMFNWSDAKFIVKCNSCGYMTPPCGEQLEAIKWWNGETVL